MSEYKTKDIPLNGDRRLINACKKAGLHCYNPQGAWNGYGYERLPMVVEITSVGEMRKFNKLKTELANKPVKTSKSDPKLSWAKRLSKLTGISVDEAISIADAKLQAKMDEVHKLNLRQCDRYSIKREKLINKVIRSNPLRYIKDVKHANAIIAAHIRHSETSYDSILDDIHELEADGTIEKGHAKEFARRIIKGDYSVYNNELNPSWGIYDDY